MKKSIKTIARQSLVALALLGVAHHAVAAEEKEKVKEKEPKRPLDIKNGLYIMPNAEGILFPASLTKTAERPLVTVLGYRLVIVSSILFLILMLVTNISIAKPTLNKFLLTAKMQKTWRGCC